MGPRHCGLRAVRWNGRTAAILETPAGNYSTAFAENNLGTAVGFITVSERLPDGYCRDGVRRAVSWDSAGHLTVLAPDYPGETMATGVNDLGEIIGVAGAPHTPLGDGYAVRFVNGTAVPLSANPRRVWAGGAVHWDRPPGPYLTNAAAGNVAVAESPSGPFPDTDAYVVTVDAGSVYPPGTVRPLYAPAAAPARHVSGISADGTVIVGTGPQVAGVRWQLVYRSGHPGYRALPAPALPNGEAMHPYGVSPDGTLTIGEGRENGGTSQVGYLHSRTAGVAVQLGPGVPSATGVSDRGLVIGIAGEQAVTWRYSN